jgi:hypothetical protein
MMVAMNTVNGAVTAYDLPFVSLVTINGRCFGAGALGIFELVGDTDNGQAIAASVRTGRLDFADSHGKRATDAYVEASSAGNLDFQVVTDSNEYSYPLGAPSVNLVNRKANLGRGIKTRRWQFGLSNASGADFEMAGMSVLVDATARRV